MNALQRQIIKLAGKRGGGSAPGGKPEHLYRWPTDPAGKKPAHTVPYKQHLHNAAPIVPGSAINNKTLGRESRAAATEKYGPAQTQANQVVTQAQQHETDVGGWYDAFLRELGQHQANVASINQQAQAATQGLANVTGPTGTATGDPGNADAETKAQAIREGILGAMRAGMAGVGRSNETYADTLTHVVGPGQKLTAQQGASRATTEARQALSDLLREKGAFRSTFEGQAKQDEGKNVLASQALGLDVAKEASSEKAGRATRREQRRHNRATEQNTAASTKASGSKGYGAGRPGLNKYGFTYDEWTRLSTAQKNKARAGKPGKPQDRATVDAKTYYRKYGVKPATQTQLNAASNKINTAKSTLRLIVGSDPKFPKLTRQQASRQIGQILLQGQPGSKDSQKLGAVDPMWATVVLDLQYLHAISRTTARRLYKAGFDPKKLGLPILQAPAKGVKRPKFRPGGSLGGFPGAK